jgi:hypothetical protein
LLKRLTASLVVAFALSVLAAPATAAVHRFASVRLPATNGYQLKLYGYDHRLYLETTRGDAGVSYTGRGVITAQRLQFDLGPRGSFDLGFEPRGKPRDRHLPPYCDGFLRHQPGVFSGIATFTGDGGYTSASATSAPGVLTTSNARCRPPPLQVEPPPGHPHPHGHRIMGLEAHAPYYAPEFEAWRRVDSGQVTFSADSWKREGAITISSYVAVRGAADSFVFGDGQRATVQPPPPFTGQAAYDGRANPQDIWTGDLAVELPAWGTVALTGPQFEASPFRGVEYVVKPRPLGPRRLMHLRLGL